MIPDGNAEPTQIIPSGGVRLVIDTACPRTVCGEKWLEHYVSQLTQDELLKIKDIQSARPFKFGDERTVHSTKKVKIPAVIAQTRCQRQKLSQQISHCS